MVSNKLPEEWVVLNKWLKIQKIKDDLVENEILDKSIKVIKGPHAVTRYGNEAINGVILISTR